MKKAKEIYALYRRADDLRNTLEEVGDKYGSHLFDIVVSMAEKLSDELFKRVGEIAAYEIDEEYMENKPTDK